MDVENYLRTTIVKYSVSANPNHLLAIGSAQAAISKIITSWASTQLCEIKLSGSVAKDTAISTSADLDLFISLKSDTEGSWQEIYNKLQTHLKNLGYQPRLQNVSMRITHSGINVDLVIGKKFASPTGTVAGLFGNHDHSIRTRKNNSWTKTNIEAQIKAIKDSGRINEIRLAKIWRDINQIDFPSIYLELSVINALKKQGLLLSSQLLSQRFMTVIRYLSTDFGTVVIEDPGNKSNRISDELSIAEKNIIIAKAKSTIGKPWLQTIW